MEILGTLGYSGEPIEIIAPETLCYLSGNGLCVIDTVKGPKDIIWRSEKGISCWSSHQETNQIIIAPNIDGHNLTLFSLTTSQVQGHLPNPAGGKIIHFSFSSDGNYLLALSDHTDHRVIMWNVQNFSILFCMELKNYVCTKCLMHPIDNLSFLLYGNESIVYCNMIEILGNYDIKFHPIQLKIESKNSLTSTSSSYASNPLASALSGDDSDYHHGITCAVWSPPSSLIVGTYDGTIYYVEPITKFSKKLFSLPSKPSDKYEFIQPIGMILSGVNLIIGTGKCQIYWYSFDPLDLTPELLDNELHFQEIISPNPEQIVSLDLESDLITSTEIALAGEGHLLTCLICDTSDYTTCIASTSDGMIYKFSSEIQQINNEEDDEDGGNDHQKQQQKQKPILLHHLPLYTLHSGAVISTHSMSIPISEYTSSQGALNSKNDGAVMTFDHAESVTVIITGSYSGAVSFWRALSPGENLPTAAGSGGGGVAGGGGAGAGAGGGGNMSTFASHQNNKSITGILKSTPRIPQRLCRRYVCDKVELDNDVSVVPHVITAFETLSLATYGGGRLLAIGTLTGWLEVWRVEAYMSEETTRHNEQELDETALNEEDILRDIKIGVQLIYRKRFYETAITAISSSDAMSCFAVSSYDSQYIYAINTSPKNKFQEIKVYTLGDQTNKPINLSWTGPLLWVPTHDGIFFTFLPEMNQEDLLHDQDHDQDTNDLNDETTTTRVTPALVDLTPIHPKVMWEIESKSICHAIPFSGSGGGCIFTKQDVSIIGLIDNYPTVFDLEHNNLLHSEPLGVGEIPEVPMLQMPGTLKYSIPMSSPIISIARAPSSSLVATGTYDGSIFIWRIKRGEITLINRYQPHSSPVINLLFTIDSSQIISCSIDGTIFITLIDKPIQSNINVVSLLLENDLYDMKQYGTVTSKKILWKDFHHQEVMNQLKETFKSKSIHFQSIVENIENRLKTLLTRNNDANELEKMDLSEFVIDVKRKEAILRENQRKENKIKEMYRLKNSINELIAGRIKQQCWDTMEVHSLTLLPIQSSSSPSSGSGAGSGATSSSGSGSASSSASSSSSSSARQALTSYSIEKLTEVELLKFQRIKKLRIIEITSQRQTLQQKGGGHIDMVGTGGNWRCCWGKNIQGTPNVITWLFNDGLRWPCQDLVKLILEQEKSGANSKENAENAGGGGGVPGGQQGKQETKDDKKKAAAGTGVGSNNKSEKGGATTGGGGAAVAAAVAATTTGGGTTTNPTNTSSSRYGATGGGGGGDGDDDDSYNTSDMITMEQEINFNNIFNLLYSPQTVRTQIQKRNQIVFIKEIIRLIKMNFNKYFEKIYHEKEDVMMNIQVKNTRINEIIKELSMNSHTSTSNGSTSAERDLDGSNILLNPQWDDIEIHNSCITINDNEIQSRPYETNAMRTQRLYDEEQKYLLELQRNNDSKERALHDMMNGTLELKRDVLFEAESALKKPEWMLNIFFEHMTDQQKKEYEEYQNKIQIIHDEQAKYYKSLELEMKKLKTEIMEIIKNFDEKLFQMCRLKILINREILAHELYITRLSLSMVKREQCWLMLKDVEKEIEENHRKRSVINMKIDQLTLATEEAKIQLTTFQDEEKVLDRSFKRDLQTMCNITFDQDILKLFTQLYRLRKFQDTGYTTNDEDADHITSTIDGRSSRNSTKRRLSLKRSMGSSKGQSRGGLPNTNTTTNHRKSKGNSISNRGDSLGPLQTAAKEMLDQESGLNKPSNNINIKNPFYSHLMIQDREKKIQESQLPLLQPLNIDLDTPEGFSIDPFVWSKLQELRLNRIMKEIAVKGQFKTYTELKKKLEMLSHEEDEIHNNAIQLRNKKDSILERMEELMNDLDVIVTVKQGQDEVDSDVVVTDYNTSKLIPTSIIQKYNNKINELGKEKITILTKIKQFRRKMNLVDWEARHLQLEGWHLEEYYTDSQLFRVTRDLQRVIREDGIDLEQNKNKQDKLIIRKEFMKKDNENKMMKMKSLIEILRGQITERRQENMKYQNKISTLKGEVAVREQVVRASTAGVGGGTGTSGGGTGGTRANTSNALTGTRGGGGTGGGVGRKNGVEMSKTIPINNIRADQKMKKIVKRRKLVDTARIQAEEIDYLKQELDKLRQKTFPSFVKATRNRLVYNPDERI